MMTASIGIAIFNQLMTTIRFVVRTANLRMVTVSLGIATFNRLVITIKVRGEDRELKYDDRELKHRDLLPIGDHHQGSR